MTNSTPRRYLLVSTYPEEGSRNVGDALITASCRQLLQIVKPDADLVVRSRAHPVDADNVEGITAVLLPGLAIRPQTLGNVYDVALDDIRCPVIGLGIGAKEDEYDIAQAGRRSPDRATRSLLDRVQRDAGALTCRDVFTQIMLERAGYRTTLIGDFALFDPERIGMRPSRPSRIDSIAFTPPRRPRLVRQACRMVAAIRKAWPHAAIDLVRHGSPTPVEEEVHRRTGLPAVDVAGDDVLALERYDDYDVHVGYRVHAHLWRMRRRQPSFLVEEDSRAVGFNRTLGTPGIPATTTIALEVGRLRRRARAARPVDAARVAVDLLAWGESTGFEIVDSAATVIDHLFEYRMLPALEALP